MLDTGLGARNTMVSKTAMVLIFLDLTDLQKRKIIHHTNKCKNHKCGK